MLLVWLLSIAIGIAVGICAAIVLAIPVIPIAVVGVAAYTTGSPFFWIAIVIGTLILLPIAVVVEGFVIAQSSTYWTLAFRRLEIDQAPAYGYVRQRRPSSLPLLSPLVGEVLGELLQARVDRNHLGSPHLPVTRLHVRAFARRNAI